MSWKNVNRNGVSRHRGWEDVNQAIEQDLCTREADFREEQYAEKGAPAQSSPPLHPLQYAIDCKRIAKQCLDEDMGGSKPTVKDKLKAAIAKAREENDVPLASRIQGQLEDTLALECVKRRKKKARKRAIR